MVGEGRGGTSDAYEVKQKLFESLMPKFGLADEDMTVENVQKLMKENASEPVLFWDHDPSPSHDPIWTSDWDFPGHDSPTVVTFPV